MNTAGTVCILTSALILTARVDAQVTLRPCTIDRQPARCGTLVVAEDHKDSSGRQLTLGIVVLGEGSRRERREPIFVLAGGPGQAATSLVPWAADIFRTVRRERDIVLMDQRGTGGAHRLDCPRAPRSFLIPADAEQCLTGLSRRAALSQYGTESFIEDIELARRALGYDRVIIYGSSYGSRAAYAYARRYPHSVRAAVLSAPAPVSMSVLDSFTEDGHRSLNAIADDCLADRSCSRAFPNLRMDVDQFRDKVTDPLHVLGLQFLQYSVATLVRIPRLVNTAAGGKLAPLDSAIAGARDNLAGQLALGLHLTIMCSEELPFGGAAAVSPLRTEYRTACRDWPKVVVPTRFHDLVPLGIPALVLVGEWDPVTSPRWAEVASRQFTPSQLVVLPKASHVLDGSETCLGMLIATFLDRSTADTSCVSAARRPPYVLR